MPQHNLDNLEKQLKELNAGLKKLAEPQSIEELLKIIRKPGYTTPAEFALTIGVVNSMAAQVTALIQLKQNLLEGSRLVTAKAAEAKT